MWHTKHAKVVGVAVAVSATCLLALFALGGCSEAGAGGGGGGGGGGGSPPQTYEETLSDGTNVSVLSPVSVTLTEAAPGSYPDGAAGPVVDIDGSLGRGETATVTLTKDPGESPFPAGTSILHNDGGPYWSVEQTDTSVDQMSVSATLSSLSPVGVGVPVSDVDVAFEEISAFCGETLTVSYTVSPLDATEQAVNVWASGWAAVATDSNDEDGEIELEFDGEGYGEIIIQSQYEPAMASFSVRSIREIGLGEAPVSSRVRPDPFDSGENYYYVDDLTPGNLYVASLEDLRPGLDREVVAVVTTVDDSARTDLTIDGYVEDAAEPLFNYYISSLNNIAPLVFRADAEYQFFAVTDGSEAGTLDFTFDLSVDEYTQPVGSYLRIETYQPDNETDPTDTSMAVFDVFVDIAAGAFDVSDTNKFSRLIVDNRTLLGCIIAVAAQREFRDPAYVPQTGGYAIMIAYDTTDTTIPIDAGTYPDESTYEVMDNWLANGTDLCVQICNNPACGLGNPGTRFLDPGDMDLMELEADFMWFDP